jgi:hypothetical protein
MLSSELGNRYAATRVFHSPWGGPTARAARKAAGEKRQGRNESDPVANGSDVAVVSKPS